jgi:hypothetical protein
MILLGQDVHHATLGIIELGRIGPAVGKRARGFNMKVICYDTVRRPDLENELEVEFADLNTPLAKSDFVTIHTPLLAETQHLIGEEQFRLVKKAATVGVKIGKSHVWRILHEAGVVYKRPKAAVRSPDPDYEEKAVKIRGYKQVASALQKRGY